MQVEFFPSRTMALYMARMFAIRVVAVLLLLVLVLQALDLLGESGKILAYPGNGQGELLTYISLRVPQLIERFLPFAVLLATIVTLATLNQNSEVIAMKAAGLSAHQVLAPLLLTSLVIAILSFAFNDRIVSRATATLAAWEAAEFGPIPEDPYSLTNVWVRDGHMIIQARTVLGKSDNTRLRDVTAFVRDENDALRETVSAARARYTGNGWRLEDVERFELLTGNVETIDSMVIGTGVTPDQFTLSNVNAAGLSFAELGTTITDMQLAGRRTTDLETTWWHKISGPLSSVLMPLLGAVAAFGLARSGRLFFRAVIGMALGFAYFVVDNFTLAMGNLEVYPPLLAAWAPFILFLLIGETVLVRTEE
ncbi:MAG: LPS export ABC transporter permease LptG [Pseudomonadota bacterium]